MWFDMCDWTDSKLLEHCLEILEDTRGKAHSILTIQYYRGIAGNRKTNKKFCQCQVPYAFLWLFHHIFQEAPGG